MGKTITVPLRSALGFVGPIPLTLLDLHINRKGIQCGATSVELGVRMVTGEMGDSRARRGARAKAC